MTPVRLRDGGMFPISLLIAVGDDYDDHDAVVVGHSSFSSVTLGVQSYIS